MPVDRAWAERNLGYDPTARKPPAEAFAFKKAAASNATPEDFQREIIDFDSQGAEGTALFAFSKATGLSRFTDIPWPKGLAPKTGGAPATGSGPLPRADVLVVTWTVDEGHALSRVLTPGKDSSNDYRPYKHNYAKIAKTMSRRSPAVMAKRLGLYWTCTIGKKKVVVFKSDSHMSQDTNKALPKNKVLPNAVVWKQIIEEVQPELVITTGGGIGKAFEVGDVIVSPIVHFVSRKWLKKAPYAAGVYKGSQPQTKYFATAQNKLFKANAKQLPPDNTRPPKIIKSTNVQTSIATTDFFGFDTAENFYKLWKLGDLSEMGDAVLGLVMKQMKDAGGKVPQWICVRNVSDPQISKDIKNIKDQANMAATIYKHFGRWSSVCSAIVCWALIAA